MAIADPAVNTPSVFDEADTEVLTEPLGPLPEKLEDGKVPLVFWPDESNIHFEHTLIYFIFAYRCLLAKGLL